MKGEQSNWALYCAIVSTFGLIGFYSEPLKGRVPDWLGVGVFVLPVSLIVLVQWGDLPDRAVAFVHFLAASIFLVASLGMELWIAAGYRPEGVTLFRVLAHLGWTFAWGKILKRAWSVSKGST